MDEELQKLRAMVTRWYERYRNMEPCESTVYMFADLIHTIVEPHLAELYRTKAITPEDYSEMMAFCEELLQSLKKELGVEGLKLVMEL